VLSISSAGQETCPSWAATGLREIHINGDIAFAVWQFWRATQDSSLAWINTTAWPLLGGTEQVPELLFCNKGKVTLFLAF